MFELVYTSAPRLLETGKTGFGTLLCTKGMPQPLVSFLERISAFDRGAGIDASECYTIYRMGGVTFHVFSRIGDCGADYTGRTNHVAHHFVIEEGTPEAQEMMKFHTPVSVLSCLASMWVTTCPAAPQYTEERRVRLYPIREGASAWTELTGSPVKARWLAVHPYDGACCLVFPGVAQISLCLLVLHEGYLYKPDKGWGCGFSTALISTISANLIPVTCLDMRQQASGVKPGRSTPILELRTSLAIPPESLTPIPTHTPPVPSSTPFPLRSTSIPGSQSPVPFPVAPPAALDIPSVQPGAPQPDLPPGERGKEKAQKVRQSKPVAAVAVCCILALILFYISSEKDRTTSASPTPSIKHRPSTSTAEPKFPTPSAPTTPTALTAPTGPAAATPSVPITPTEPTATVSPTESVTPAAPTTPDSPATLPPPNEGRIVLNKEAGVKIEVYKVEWKKEEGKFKVKVKGTFSDKERVEQEGYRDCRLYIKDQDRQWDGDPSDPIKSEAVSEISAKELFAGAQSEEVPPPLKSLKKIMEWMQLSVPEQEVKEEGIDEKLLRDIRSLIDYEKEIKKKVQASRGKTKEAGDALMMHLKMYRNSREDEDEEAPEKVELPEELNELVKDIRELTDKGDEICARKGEDKKRLHEYIEYIKKVKGKRNEFLDEFSDINVEDKKLKRALSSLLKLVKASDEYIDALNEKMDADMRKGKESGERKRDDSRKRCKVLHREARDAGEALKMYLNSREDEDEESPEMVESPDKLCEAIQDIRNSENKGTDVCAHIKEVKEKRDSLIRQLPHISDKNKQLKKTLEKMLKLVKASDEYIDALNEWKNVDMTKVKGDVENKVKNYLQMRYERNASIILTVYREKGDSGGSAQMATIEAKLNLEG